MGKRGTEAHAENEDDALQAARHSEQLTLVQLLHTGTRTTRTDYDHVQLLYT